MEHTLPAKPPPPPAVCKLFRHNKFAPQKVYYNRFPGKTEPLNPILRRHTHHLTLQQPSLPPVDVVHTETNPSQSSAGGRAGVDSPCHSRGKQKKKNTRMSSTPCSRLYTKTLQHTAVTADTTIPLEKNQEEIQQNRLHARITERNRRAGNGGEGGGGKGGATTPLSLRKAPLPRDFLRHSTPSKKSRRYFLVGEERGRIKQHLLLSLSVYPVFSLILLLSVVHATPEAEYTHRAKARRHKYLEP